MGAFLDLEFVSCRSAVSPLRGVHSDTRPNEAFAAEVMG